MAVGSEMLPAIEALPYIYRRPKDPALCGPSKTLEWENLYRLNLSQMGRSLVCHNCHNQDACTWYEKDKDSDKFLTLQSQDYLFKELALISDQALTILDELKFFDLPIQRRADRRELEKYKRILLDFPALQNLIYLTDCLLTERKINNDRLKQTFTRDEKKRLNKESFKFHKQLSFNEVYNFTQLVNHQAKLSPFFRDQAIYYNSHPKISGALLVAVYGADKELLEYYFQRPFTDLTPKENYVHPGSRFYQLTSTSTSYFKFIKNPRSRAGILRFAGAKIEANRLIGKKTLLVTKKGTVDLVLKEMPQYFAAKPHPKLCAFTPQSSKSLDGINVIPLLHYGVEGINLFENYDCVICLTAYNLRPEVIANQLKQLGIGRDIQVEIRNTSNGLGREVFTDPDTPLAKAIFAYLEHDKILQTVSRARPFTTPTEVIFAGHQEFSQSIVFNDVRNLARALEVGSDTQRISKIKRLLAEGLSQKIIARRLRVSGRTVSRYMREIKRRNQL